MATQKHDWLGRLYGSAKEAKANAKTDEQQRLSAGKGPTSRILHQNDVLTGKWTPSRALQTTLGGPGGHLRDITQADLAAFKENIKTIKSKGKYEKGITAKEIIDWSSNLAFGCHKSDLALSIEQIKHATPVSAYNGRVRFITNAGPDSDVTRHHVFIVFERFASITGRQETSRKVALDVRKGPLLIECDCGKWRFWYRYIATIGGYNSGRAETGFPKIRNPRLTNVACKHIVKVANEIQNIASVLSFLTKMVDKSRASDLANVMHRSTQEESEKDLNSQLRRKSNAIKTSAEKSAARKEKLAAKAAADKIKPPARLRQSSRISGLDANAREAALRKGMAKFGLVPSPEQIEAVRNAK